MLRDLGCRGKANIGWSVFSRQPFAATLQAWRDSKSQNCEKLLPTPWCICPIKMERQKVKGQLHRSYLKLCPSAVAKAATMVPFEQSDFDVTKGCEKSAARDQLISSFNGGSEP
uniref:Uncharacterized protein n=1 Tax=Ananas comosus var. bracteatus TaxID=296719 RepID=A0A6V7PM70_ANACO|nr:unnamed protein product [Ananas comosus var. bracteatus]